MSRGRQDGDQCRGGGLAAAAAQRLHVDGGHSAHLPAIHSLHRLFTRGPSGRDAAVDSEVGAWLCCPKAVLGSAGLCVAHARAPGAPHVGIR